MPTIQQDSRRVALAAICLLTVVAALLRLPTLGVQSLWYDEAATWSQVNGSFWKLISDTASDNYPPLYNLLAWPLVQTIGDAEWVLRLPAALLGIATVPLIYGLGVRLSGRATGLLAALFLTLSGFHVWYSQEARMYSLLAFAATAHAWVLLRYLQQPSTGRRNALIASGAMLLFTHPYGPLTWLAMGAGALLAPPRPAAGSSVRKLIKYHAISAAIFLPWGVALLVHAVEITIGQFWIPAPTPPYVWEQLQSLSGNLFLPLAACVLLAVVRPATLPAEMRFALPVLLAWLLGPALLGLVASVLTKPVFIARYLNGSLPALLLLAAYGITRWLPRPTALAAAVAAAAAVATASLVLASPAPRGDWRAAVAAVDRSLGADDCVTIVPAYNGPLWHYYSQQDVECLMERPESIGDRAPAGARLFVIVESGFDLPAPLSAFVDGLPPPVTSDFYGISVRAHPARPAS